MSQKEAIEAKILDGVNKKVSVFYSLRSDREKMLYLDRLYEELFNISSFTFGNQFIEYGIWKTPVLANFNNLGLKIAENTKDYSQNLPRLWMRDQAHLSTTGYDVPLTGKDGYRNAVKLFLDISSGSGGYYNVGIFDGAFSEPITIYVQDRKIKEVLISQNTDTAKRLLEKLVKAIESTTQSQLLNNVGLNKNGFNDANINIINRYFINHDGNCSMDTIITKRFVEFFIATQVEEGLSPSQAYNALRNIGVEDYKAIFSEFLSLGKNSRENATYKPNHIAKIRVMSALADQIWRSRDPNIKFLRLLLEYKNPVLSISSETKNRLQKSLFKFLDNNKAFFTQGANVTGQAYLKPPAAIQKTVPTQNQKQLNSTVNYGNLNAQTSGVFNVQNFNVRPFGGNAVSRLRKEPFSISPIKRKVSKVNTRLPLKSKNSFGRSV